MSTLGFFVTRQLLSCFSVSLVLVSGSASSQSVNGTRPHAGMLRFPAISKTHIVFSYANDLWIVPKEGGMALPLSSPPGQESMPRFSPDGDTIAFVGNYEGGRDIYTMSVEGGSPTRITYHPAGKVVCGWSPDGKIIFSTNGYAGLPRQQQLFTVSKNGGIPTRLPVPYGEEGAISPDGRMLAYTPHSTDIRTWKRYRGGMATDIWLFDLKEKTSQKITDWEGTDTAPMWQGSQIIYLSDNGPEHRLNLWSYDTLTHKRTQKTRYADYDLKWPSIGPGTNGKGEVVFQYGAKLMRYELGSDKATEVLVRIPGDKFGVRDRTLDASGFITNFAIAPSGQRAVVEARGDIWIAPIKEGTPRNLTRTSKSAERSPSWSPDGKWIAYFSDATGDYEIYTTPADGKGTPTQLTKGSKTYYYNPSWSPNSRFIAYTDKAGILSIYDTKNKTVKTVVQESVGGQPTFSWSTDSRFIAYDLTDPKLKTSAIWIYNVEANEKKQVTSGMFNETAPAFDRVGDYLYFASSRAFNPTYEDLGGTTWIYNNSQVLVALPLREDVASPYLPKIEIEPVKAEPKAEVEIESTVLVAKPVLQKVADENVSGVWNGSVKGDNFPGGMIAFKLTLKLNADNTVTGTIASDAGSASVAGTYVAATKTLLLTFDLNGATITFTGVISGATMNGTAGPAGQPLPFTALREGGEKSTPVAPNKSADPAKSPVAEAPKKITIDFDKIEMRAFALSVPSGNFRNLAVNDKNQLLYVRSGQGQSTGIYSFDLKDELKVEKPVAPGIGGFDLSPDGKKILYPSAGGATIQEASAGGAKEAVVTGGMSVTVHPREEWKQIFDEAWRLQRDFFYDPTMHGVDWNAVHAQYAAMLPDAATREDVGFIISEMISELNVGHAYYSGGEVERGLPSIGVGVPGVDFALENGAYRITKIYRGAAWDTDAVGALSLPGVKVKEGDYLLAVNGVPVDTHKDPYAAFVGLNDRVITLTVSEKPSLDSTSREIATRLPSSDATLRYRAWIENKRAFVDKMTGGRVGYIYVPNTGTDGQSDLVRQLLGQRGKDALIIDERWNAGGQIPTRFIELLNRPVTNYWARRDQQDWVWPPDAATGPKCMLINGLAGSGGDAFPYYFKQAGLGKLIGTRTWGGLVGISGYPPLLDGASVTAPSFAFYKLDGNWGIEGHGVDPDIMVMDDPAQMQNDNDPQLNVAIKQMLTDLKTKAFIPAKRPNYPNRVKMGIENKDK
ncbi:MAG: PD40 domain-containing protein [Chthonomonadaceae bacterium]|nr:PD40 domain-containing protein [Chthonomonadaceae bacterium]